MKKFIFFILVLSIITWQISTLHAMQGNQQEDNKPKTLTATQRNTIKGLDGSGIVDWWDKHMKEFHFNTQASYSKSVSSITDEYTEDKIDSPEFKRRLLETLL